MVVRADGQSLLPGKPHVRDPLIREHLDRLDRIYEEGIFHAENLLDSQRRLRAELTGGR